MNDEKQYYPEGVTRDKVSATEAIRAYYETQDSRHPVLLTDKQEEIHERLIAAHAKLLKKGSMEATIRFLVNRFDISERQARRDLVDAINLFGNVTKAQREGMRYILYEKAMKAYKFAKKELDAKAAVAAIKVAAQIMGLDKEDPEIPDFERIQPSLNVLVVPDNVMQLLQQMVSKGAVNLNKSLGELTDYEVIDEDEADAG